MHVDAASVIQEQGEQFKKMQACVLSQPYSHTVSERLMFSLEAEEEEEEEDSLFSNIPFADFMSTGKALPSP